MRTAFLVDLTDVQNLDPEMTVDNIIRDQVNFFCSCQMTTHLLRFSRTLTRGADLAALATMSTHICPDNFLGSVATSK
jgi:hypothetical protein